jgi:hypothetical protein
MAWAWTGIGGHLVSYDPPFAVGSAQTYVRVVPANWRSDFRFAWQGTRPRTRRGPRPHLAATHPRHWSGFRNGKLHGTITTDGDRWLAYVRLEDPPGLSPITTVGRHRRRGTDRDRRGVGVPLTDHGMQSGRSRFAYRNLRNSPAKRWLTPWAHIHPWRAPGS